MTDREYLFSLEQIGIKLGLEQIRLLLHTLGRPDLAFPSIVVAGTNGKGSVTAMIERGLRAAGYRTGRYTSPHLTHIEERIAIDGEPISPAAFDRLAARMRAASAALPAPPSFFEATTALALEAFRDAAVDVAVLEVGLGGRLDATNAVTPVLSVITSIDMDHQQYLGDTIEKIASEKAGIIKPGVSIVLGSNTEEVGAVIQQTANAQRAPLAYAPDGARLTASMVDGVTTLSVHTAFSAITGVQLALRGRHQVVNAITALRALEQLDNDGLLHVPSDARVHALESVVWPARLELRKWRNPATGTDVDVLIDGAHNPAGAGALTTYLSEAYGRPLPIIFAAMQDKDIDGLIRALAPAAGAFICTRAHTPRAADPAVLAAHIASLFPGTVTITAASPSEALAAASSVGQPVVAAGSLYLAGEIRELLS